jgi:hypothetical protein
MVDLRALYASGYNPKKLRQLFVPDAGPAARKDKIRDLLELTSGRIREGVNRQLKHARHWWVIDQACDVSNRAMSATTMRGIRSLNPDPRAMIKTMQEWGLSALLNPVLDDQGNPKSDTAGRTLYKIDDSPIVEIIAPICQQYLNARWATLVTGRDSSPWLKYSPLIYTRENHFKTQIFTSRAEQMVNEMGYRADFRQESLCALKYGYQFTFAMEPYYWEKQQHMGDGGLREVVVREGIRVALPHPSRTFFDLGHRMSTLNTNTGLSYAGYWDIYKWGDVLANPDFWLTEDQRAGRFGSGTWIEASSWSEYSQLFPMTMNLPQQIYSNNSRSDNDRTAEANRLVYTGHDQGVVLTPIFQKLNPKEWGLFDYDGDVWFCFTMANGDTPILVEPYGYTPVRVMQYQGDQSHWRPTSMVTDLVPFQDSVGNLLTQYLMTVRRNLLNIIYYNKDTVKKEEIDHLMGQATGLWTGPNLVPVSFKLAQLDSTTAQISDQFKAVTFPAGDTIAVVNAINTMLGVIERVIGFTAQEVGTTGSHIQTAEEIRVTTDFANNRIALTDAFFDHAIGAQKVQIYEAFMNYGDDLVMGQIADASEADRATLEKMGVLIEEGEGRKMGVMTNKTALSLSAFASDREGSRRTNDAQIATAFMQFAQTVFSVQPIAEAIGVDGLVEVFNTVAQFSGFGPDARLKLPTNGQPAMPQIMQQVQQMVQQIMEGQMTAIGEGLRKEVLEPLEAKMTELASKNAELEQAMATLLSQIQQPPQPMQQMLPMMV